MNNYDPSTATVTDQVFVATLLKTILEDEKIRKGMPESVANYLEYTLNKIINKINTELTLDVIKTMGEFSKEDNKDE